MMAQTELCWFEPIRDGYLRHYLSHSLVQKKNPAFQNLVVGEGYSASVCVCVGVYLCLVGEGSL